MNSVLQLFDKYISKQSTRQLRAREIYKEYSLFIGCVCMHNMYLVFSTSHMKN